jgi:hypothetical protein
MHRPSCAINGRAFQAALWRFAPLQKLCRKIYHIPHQKEMQINNLMAAAILCETALWAPDKMIKAEPARLGVAV